LDRLREKTVNTQTGFDLSPEAKQRVLKARARTLARETAGAEEGETYLEVVEFVVAHERYAIELAHIREIYPLKALTPLPGTPPFVIGILNVRGRIISVIDIKKFFELPDAGLTDLNKVIILHSREMEFGILAEAIIGVKHIPANRVQPSLPTLTGMRNEYLKGVTKDRVVILAGEKLLSDEKMVVQ